MAARKRAAAEAFGAVATLDRPWLDQLDRDPRSGRALGHVWNVVTLLTHHPDWRGVLAYDDFAHDIVMRSPPPWGGEAGAWTDATTAALQEWLSDPRIALSATDTKAMQGVLRVAQGSTFNPPLDYLTGLEWDHEPRLRTFLSDYFGAEQNEYTARAGINWLVSCAARIIEPGCKVDTMLVLESPQGAGKTQCMRILGGPWYAEATALVGSKDFMLGMQGVWIVEVAELDSFTRAEDRSVKKMLSAVEDKFRVPYGRRDERFSRTCVFVGTTNEGEYLKDPTGARRYWPVKCGDLAVDALRLNRDQLWAEAVHLYRHGGDPSEWPDDTGAREATRARGWRWWWMPPRANLEQERRFQVDPWESLVQQWLDGHAPAAQYPVDVAGEQRQATTIGLLQHAIAKKTGDITRQDEMRVGHLLRHLGWRRARTRLPNGARTYMYYRTEHDASVAEQADERAWHEEQGT